MRKEVEIANKLGLHARPAALFVRTVIRFESTITIWKGQEKFSAASLLDVLTANLDCGARVVLEAVGPDEQEALSELEALLLRFRDEEAGFRETDARPGAIGSLVVVGCLEIASSLNCWVIERRQSITTSGLSCLRRWWEQTSEERSCHDRELT